MLIAAATRSADAPGVSSRIFTRACNAASGSGITADVALPIMRKRSPVRTIAVWLPSGRSITRTTCASTPYLYRRVRVGFSSSERVWQTMPMAMLFSAAARAVSSEFSRPSDRGIVLMGKITESRVGSSGSASVSVCASSVQPSSPRLCTFTIILFCSSLKSILYTNANRMPKLRIFATFSLPLVQKACTYGR